MAAPEPEPLQGLAEESRIATERLFHEFQDQVAYCLSDVIDRLFPTTPENERIAATLAVADMLGHVSLRQDLFDADLDAIRLEKDRAFRRAPPPELCRPRRVFRRGRGRRSLLFACPSDHNVDYYHGGFRDCLFAMVQAPCMNSVDEAIVIHSICPICGFGKKLRSIARSRKTLRRVSCLSPLRGLCRRGADVLMIGTSPPRSPPGKPKSTAALWGFTRGLSTYTTHALHRGIWAIDTGTDAHALPSHSNSCDIAPRTCGGPRPRLRRAKNEGRHGVRVSRLGYRAHV
jgi:hypothetical protein